ncbi:hypothetical protein BJV77DRAFT_1154981 [Russula vinacea]|nr:hypothetical protein BJV77DRAFT_1154981 [Russula vinacea]
MDNRGYGEDSRGNGVGTVIGCRHRDFGPDSQCSGDDDSLESSPRLSLASSTQCWSRISGNIYPVTFLEGSGTHWSDCGPNTLFEHWDQLPQPVELGHTLARWCTSNDQNTAQIAQGMVSKILWNVRERDDRWFELAARVYGLPERDLRDIVAHGDDSVSLAILIQMTRAAILRGPIFEVLTDFIKFDIRNTLSGLQHDFCTLWNEIVQEAKKQGYSGTNALILKDLRHLYIALHQGTDAAPTAFSASTYRFDPILFEPSTYPSCDIPSHRPDSIAHSADPPIPIPTQPGHSPDAPPGHSTYSTSGCSTVNNAVAGPPSSSHPTTSIEFGDGSPALAAISPTLPVHTPSCPSDASPPGVVVATRQDIPLATTTSHPLEGTTQRDVVVLCTEPDVLSTTSTTSPTPTLASALASKQPVLNKSSESYDAGSASVFNLSLPASSVVGFSSPIPPPSSRDTPLPNAESLSLLGSTAASSPIENPTLPRLRARGLVNTGGTAWSRESGDTIGGCHGRGGKPREDKDATKEHKAVDSFEPMYMYDAMKERRQLKDLLDGQQQDAEEFFRIYLDALEEESLALLASISGHKLAAAAPGVEEREMSQSGQIDVGRRSLKVESVESPLTRIFSGKFRSTVRAPNQPDTVTIEDWQSLQLDIQHDSVHTIEDALARISHMQPVRLGPSGNEASQRVLIEALPPVLVLHLKRFLYDAATNGINKIGKPVQIAPELDILPDIMAPFAGKSVEPVHYKLYGVLYHHGKSAGSGHYTIDVLHQNGGSGNGEVWLHIDDEAI